MSNSRVGVVDRVTVHAVLDDSLTRERVQEIYGAGAAFYDDVMADSWRALIDRARVAEALSQRSGGRYLEIGVGTGLNIVHWRPDAEWQGVDFTAPMLERATARASSAHHATALMDGSSLDFEAGTFDGVLITLVVSAAPDPLRLLSEARRVCGPGGVLSLLDVSESPMPAVANIQRHLIRPYAINIGFPAPSPSFPGGVIAYDPNRNMEQLAGEAGWCITEVETFNPENPFTCRTYLVAESQ